MEIIYGLSSSSEPDNIRYIGKTNNIKNRLKRHLSKYYLKENTYKNNWIKSELSKGNEIISKELFIVNNNENWEEVEIEWINKYRNLGYDLTNGTNGGEGFNINEDVILKRSKTIIEKNILKKQEEIEKFKITFNDGKWKGLRICPCCKKEINHISENFNGIINLLRKSTDRKCLSCRSIGRKFTEESIAKMSKSKENISQETRDKISKIHKGKIIKEETRNKISRSLIGRKLSEETKLKMSISRKGKKYEKDKISFGDSTDGQTTYRKLFGVSSKRT